MFYITFRVCGIKNLAFDTNAHSCLHILEFFTVWAEISIRKLIILPGFCPYQVSSACLNCLSYCSEPDCRVPSLLPHIFRGNFHRYRSQTPEKIPLTLLYSVLPKTYPVLHNREPFCPLCLRLDEKAFLAANNPPICSINKASCDTP